MHKSYELNYILNLKWSSAFNFLSSRVCDGQKESLGGC